MKLYIEGVGVGVIGDLPKFKESFIFNIDAVTGGVLSDTVTVAATQELQAALGYEGFNFKVSESNQRTYNGILLADDQTVRVSCVLTNIRYKRHNVYAFDFTISTGNAAWFVAAKQLLCKDTFPYEVSVANWLMRDITNGGVYGDFSNPCYIPSKPVLLEWVGSNSGISKIEPTDNWYLSCFTPTVSYYDLLTKGFEAMGYIPVLPEFLRNIVLACNQEPNGDQPLYPIPSAKLFGNIATTGIVILAPINDNYAGFKFTNQEWHTPFKGRVRVNVKLGGVAYTNLGQGLVQIAKYFTTGGSPAVFDGSEFDVDAGDFFRWDCTNVAPYSLEIEFTYISVAEDFSWIPTQDGFNTESRYIPTQLFIPKAWNLADILASCAELFNLRVVTSGNTVTVYTSQLSDAAFENWSLPTESYFVDNTIMSQLELSKDANTQVTPISNTNTIYRYSDHQIPSVENIEKANDRKIYEGKYNAGNGSETNVVEVRCVAAPNLFLAPTPAWWNYTGSSPFPSGAYFAAIKSNSSEQGITDKLVPLVYQDNIFETNNILYFDLMTALAHQYSPYSDAIDENYIQLTFGGYTKLGIDKALNNLFSVFRSEMLNVTLFGVKTSGRLYPFKSLRERVNIDGQRYIVESATYDERKTLSDVVLLGVPSTTIYEAQNENAIFNFLPTSGSDTLTYNDTTGELVVGSNSVTIPPASGTAVGGDLTGTVSNAQIAAGAVGTTELASTTVVAGSYKYADFTVDQDGRLTAASGASIIKSSAGFNAISGSGFFAYSYFNVLLEANSIYEIEIYAVIQMDIATSGTWSFDYEAVAPAVFGGRSFLICHASTAGAGIKMTWSNLLGTETTPTSNLTNWSTNAIAPQFFKGRIEVGVTGGIFRPRFRANTGTTMVLQVFLGAVQVIKKLI